MVVPTKDYSPLMRSNQARGQGEQSRFIAPTIKYQTESLKIQKKGIEQKIGAISQQQGFQTAGFLIGAGQLAVKTAQVVHDYQSDQASIKTKQAADNWNTALWKGVADGTITMTENGVQGLETLNSLQDSQMADIDSQHWFGSVKRDAKNALKGFYSERENAINQAIYRDTIEKKAAIDQANIDSYINNDASRITDITPDNAYRLTDEYINSRTTWSDLTKENAKITAHAEIDWKRAENSVRMASMRSTQDGHAEADRVADEKNYDNTQRTQLHAIVNGTGKQMTADLGSEGLNTMAQGLQEGIDPMEIWKAADEKADGLSEEYKTAYKKGMETAQLSYCNDIVADLTSGIDDAITSTDIQNIKSDLEASKGKFQGGRLSEALYENTMAMLDKAEALQTTEDFDQQYQALASTILPKLDSREMSPKQAFAQLDIMMDDAGDNANKVAVVEKLTAEVVKKFGEDTDPAIKRTREVIKESYTGRYGKDFLTAQGKEYDDIRVLYQQNLEDADAKIMDLCLNKGKLTPSQTEVEAQKIRDDFRNRNQEIFKNIDSTLEYTSPGTSGKASGKTETDPFTALYTKDVDALRAKRSELLKKDDNEEAAKVGQKADTLDAIGKSSSETLSRWRPWLVENYPSVVQAFDAQMRANYYKFSENPEQLDKFAELRTTGDPPKVIKDRAAGTAHLEMDAQYDQMKDLEDDFMSVENTPQGRTYFANMTKQEEAMLNSFFKQTDIPNGSDAWQTVYMPHAGFTYTKGDGTVYRIVKGNNKGEYKVQGNYGNSWTDLNPNIQQYSIYTPEGFTEYTEENRQERKASLGYGRAFDNGLNKKEE